MRNSPRWNLPLLASLNGVAVLLALSWLWPVTRDYWDHWDTATFRLLNNSLVAGSGWRWVWGLANCRAFDLVGGSLLFLPVFCYIRQQERWRLGRGWLAVAVLVGSLFLTRSVVVAPLFEEVLHYYRKSPTLALDNCWELSLYFPQLHLKDRSPFSFPGDHGCVVLTLTLFLWLRGSRRQLAVATLVSLIVSLPRLVAGAHWMTDLVIGSMTISLVLSAWLLATPLLDETVDFLLRHAGAPGDLQERPHSAKKAA